MTIAAIETVYNGYRFRSRLEARWAVYFDELGIKYEYEPEGYRLSDGRGYLPDFRFLPGQNLPKFAEVKYLGGDFSKTDRFVLDGGADMHWDEGYRHYGVVYLEGSPAAPETDLLDEVRVSRRWRAPFCGNCGRGHYTADFDPDDDLNNYWAAGCEGCCLQDLCPDEWGYYDKACMECGPRIADGRVWELASGPYYGPSWAFANLVASTGPHLTVHQQAQAVVRAERFGT